MSHDNDEFHKQHPDSVKPAVSDTNTTGLEVSADKKDKAPGWFKALFFPVMVVMYTAYKFKSVLLLVLKFPLFKFIPTLLKTGGTMMMSVWFYALAWGIWYAIGIIYLLFIHEMGHYIAARRLGLNVGAPVFIPFLGAAVALKEAPKNAWIEAQVGIAGPVLGTIGAILMHIIYLISGNPLFAAIAYTGYFLNLFNLAPLGVLDGGRVVTVFSRWLWLLGLAIMVLLLIYRFNVIMVLVIAVSLPRIFSLFRKQTDEEMEYFSVTPAQRRTMALLYFGLIGFLSVGMLMTMVTPP